MKRISLTLLAGIIAASLVQVRPFPSLAAAGLSAQDASEIATSYNYLTTEFYKKVDSQDVLDGVHSELQSTLKKAGYTSNVPALHAGMSPTANVHAIDFAVENAEKATHDKVSATALSYAAISGMMNSVHDRWTVFLDPKEFAELNQGLDGGNFGGTGIVIQTDDATKYIAVTEVVPGGPADKAGIQPNDLITAVDGVSTKNMPTPKASQHLRGKEGTKVTLTIERSGKTLAPITLTREKIHELSVYDKMLSGNIGYVDVTVFGKDTGDELQRALTHLRSEGARAVIMDLRDNGGGYLDAAVSVSSQFISSGPIVSVESRGSNITTLEANNTAIPPVPLAVLVNGYTASASEITSGAIQDSGVGTIVGTKTFGKGVVQTIYPLPDGSAVKITTARYLTPNNRDINKVGITPDIVVGENKDPRFGDPSKDAQLQRAIQYVDDRLAHLNEINGGSGSSSSSSSM
jgi:carboxyl-terminal processing protease